jgi:hypothetical protein
LEVYSEAEPVRVNSGPPYYIHSSYLIQTPDGWRVQWVANHLSDTDESPQVVLLPAGAYPVLVQSADYGGVSVPVVIQPFRDTKIHLDGKGSWKPQLPPKNEGESVRLPNGEANGCHELVGKQRRVTA